jgi:hypothetical protein
LSRIKAASDGAGVYGWPVSLALDTSRSFRTSAELRQLAIAVRDASKSEQETDWLEWKGQANLGARRWQFEIARQILGFANRDPARAQAAAEGCGYLVIGVEPGTLRGIEPVDVAVLQTGVAQYVGSGPRWSDDYVEIEGLHVFVVTIEAPRNGDPISPLEREYSYEENERKVHHKAGEIFVRRHGKTERASPSDIRILSQRARIAAERINVSIALCGSNQLQAVGLSEEMCDAWIDHERQILTEPLKAVPESVIRTLAETRRSEEYLEEVSSYLAEVKANFFDLVGAAALRTRLNPLEVALENLTEDNYEEVVVELEIEGARSYFDKHDLDESEALLPERPRAWAAPRQRNQGFYGVSMIRPEVMIPNLHYKSPGWVTNRGLSSAVRYRERHLRPRKRLELDPLYVVVDSQNAGKTIDIAWSATSTSASGVASGILSAAVGRDLFSLGVLLKGTE